MRSLHSCIGIALLFVTAGCGGGAQTASPAPNESGTGKASVTIKVAIPSKPAASVVRNGKYVSTATQSMRITVNGFSSTTVNVTTPGCCTATVTAPVGPSDTFVITLYDGSNGTGSILSSGSVSAAVSASGPNSVSLSVGGVAAACTIAPATLGLLRTSANTVAATFTCLDADHATIIGSTSYANAPIPIAVSDTLGTATIQVNSGTAGSSATVNAPGDTLTIRAAAAPTIEDVTVSASAPSVTIPSVTLSNEIVWVLDFRCSAQDNRVLGYPALAGGSVSPEVTIDMGSCGGFGAVNGVASDASSNVFVSDFNHQAIAYVPFGNTTFSTTITGASTGIQHGQGMYVDNGASLLYLANFGGPGNVLAFPTAATGNASPSVTLSAVGGAKDVTLDGAGHLWATDDSANAIDRFDLPVSNGQSPSTTIAGSNTMLNNPGGLAVAHNGTIYVSANQGSTTLLVFAPGASGNATPSKVITFPASIDGVVMDHLGNVFVFDNTTSISRYDPSTAPSSGAWLPASSITGPGETIAVGTVY